MKKDNNRFIIEAVSAITALPPNPSAEDLRLAIGNLTESYDITRLSVPPSPNDIAEKVELFIASRSLEGKSPVTLKDYRLELALFAEFCALPVESVTAASVREYLSSLEGRKISTIGKKLSVLKSFFGWLHSEEFIPRNPTLKISLPKKPKRLLRSLSVEEIEIVRESCDDLRERAIMEVFFSTGCRLSELTNIRLDDVNLANRTINVVGKGDAERLVYLSFKATHHLNKYLASLSDDCEYLFVTKRRPFRKMGVGTVSDVIEGIEKKSGIGKSITPHVFRHSFAQLAVDSGMNLEDLQHLLGHSNPSTTLTYATVSEERKRDAHSRYHTQ